MNTFIFFIFSLVGLFFIDFLIFPFLEFGIVLFILSCISFCNSNFFLTNIKSKLIPELKDNIEVVKSMDLNPIESSVSNISVTPVNLNH